MNVGTGPLVVADSAAPNIDGTNTPQQSPSRQPLASLVSSDRVRIFVISLEELAFPRENRPKRKCWITSSALTTHRECVVQHGVIPP